MNQRTFALLLAMQDAMGRPLLSPMPQGQPTYALAGSPITIASRRPDVMAGSIPVAFGEFQRRNRCRTQAADASDRPIFWWILPHIPFRSPHWRLDHL
jgi:HK97 family phage major capsid protein